ncbi:MAG TPA: TIR domain-containing protein [Caulobacteraceae bacterium]
MADVFVSYARESEAFASRVAAGLKAAGYDVWWDSKLLPHHTFAQSIEIEVRAAKAVVVLWSEHAIQSQWVRAEADLARHLNKLVQTSIGDCAIPLPFNQVQTARLDHWDGNASDPQWSKVLASVAFLVGGSPEGGDAAATLSELPIVTQRPPERAVGVRSGRPSRSFLIGATALGLLLAGGLWFGAQQLFAPPRSERIAVQPFEVIGRSPALQDFAATLSDSLETVLAQDQLQILSRSDAETLRGPDLAARLKALNVGLVFNGTVHGDGDVFTVGLHLEEPLQHVTLWSAEISGPGGQPEALQAKVGARTVAVLNCSAQALRPTGGLTDPAVLQGFLHACDLAEVSDHGLIDEKSALEMLGAMRDVARRAPNFAPAHSVLAKHLAFLAPGPEDPTSGPLRQEADHEAHLALQLDARDPDAYVALGLLAPHADYAQRERYFRQALAIDPAWPHANGFLGNVMTDLGRLNEATTLYERAAAVNPLSIDWSNMVAVGLIKSGQTQQADAQLAHLAQLWPGGRILWVAQLDSMIAQHRWAEALDLLAPTRASPSIPAEVIGQWRELLIALKTRDAAALQALRRKAVATGGVSPQWAIRNLALMGFVDDAYSVAARYSPAASDSPDFLFEPATEALRRDRRFIALAAKFHLPDYWRRTGVWADFCGQPGLPYDCKEEAAKLLGRR